MQRILVIVGHRDDETIGAGGLIARSTASGDEVLAISMTDGVSSRIGETDQEVIRGRQRNSEVAAEILGFNWGESARFPDNQLDSVPLLEIVRFIESEASNFKPDVVITHSPLDLNIDHSITARATLTAFRPQPDLRCREILSMEVSSATDYGSAFRGEAFLPDTYFDISSVYDLKERALLAYEEEIRPYPHSRSMRGIELRALSRGAEVGIGHAEAFRTHRRILRSRWPIT